MKKRSPLERLEAISLPTAGFYFEEGGCFGFAAALHDLLARRGVQSGILVAERGFVHAYVRAEGRCFDHQGAGACPRGPRPVPREALPGVAASHGVSRQEFEADRAWAEEELEALLR